MDRPDAFLAFSVLNLFLAVNWHRLRRKMSVRLVLHEFTITFSFGLWYFIFPLTLFQGSEMVLYNHSFSKLKEKRSIASLHPFFIVAEEQREKQQRRVSF
jgi:hypothetical protein